MSTLCGPLRLCERKSYSLRQAAAAQIKIRFSPFTLPAISISIFTSVFTCDFTCDFTCVRIGIGIGIGIGIENNLLLPLFPSWPWW